MLRAASERVADFFVPKYKGVDMAMKFTPGQIRAIKSSPAGKLPRFISAGMGVGKAPGVRSLGANVRVGNKSVGASIGYDKNKKKVFGSANVNGKTKASFGPREPRYNGE